MRIIEPKKSLNGRKLQSHKRRSYVRPILISLPIITVGVLFLSLGNSYRDTALKSAEQSTALATSISSDPSKVAGVSDSKFDYYTGEQFQNLFSEIVYPNTKELIGAPSITGNAKADDRIRTIAESRGYSLHPTPMLPIIQTGLTNDDEGLLQPKAAKSLALLKAQAEKDKIPLVLGSGYRSIEVQRELFVARLNQAGDFNKVLAGQADEAIVRVLSSTAPPGYSRHHTGYTVDLNCDDGTNNSFLKTSCFEWISKDNYRVAKRAGFVPSYPEGADSQGPEPEPWEYVWVGISTLLNS